MLGRPRNEIHCGISVDGICSDLRLNLHCKSRCDYSQAHRISSGTSTINGCDGLLLSHSAFSDYARRFPASRMLETFFFFFFLLPSSIAAALSHRASRSTVSHRARDHSRQTQAHYITPSITRSHFTGSLITASPSPDLAPTHHTLLTPRPPHIHPSLPHSNPRTRACPRRAPILGPQPQYWYPYVCASLPCASYPSYPCPYP